MNSRAYPIERAAILFGQTEILQNCRYFGALIVKEGLELRVRHVKVEPAALLEHLLPSIALDHLVDSGGQRFKILSLDVGRCDQATPGWQDHINSLLFERRAIDSLNPLRRRDADQAELPGLDLACEFLPAADADGDVASKDGTQRLAATSVRDVVNLARINANRLGDLPGQNVVDTGNSAAAPGN